MYKVIFSFALIIASAACYAQDYVWPILSREAGDGILSQPQQYIDGSLNYEELYISAPQGTYVIAPTSGYIDDLFIAERLTRFDINYWDIRKGSFNQCIADILNSDKKLSVNPSFLSGHISIRTLDGNHILIGGLRGDQTLSTGQYIAKGSVLGVVGYDLKSFNVPHISFSLRNETMDPLDPMKPFGLPSTFIPPKKTTHPAYLSRSKTEEDLRILFDTYEECYPMLYERVSKEKFESYRDSCLNALPDSVTYVHLYYTIRATTSRQLLNDSHLSILSPIPALSEKYLVPQYRLGVSGDSLAIMSAPSGKDQYLGKTVKSINNIDSRIWIERLYDNLTLFDEQAIASKCDTEMNGWNLIYGEDVHNLKSQHLILSDNEEIYDEWVVNNSVKRTPSNFDDVSYANNLEKAKFEHYSFKALCDTVTLLTITTFSLNEDEIKQIEDYVLSPDASPYMIIDLRNNAGGDEEVMGRILSLFIGKPIAEIRPYEVVNDTCSYKAFAFASNFPTNAKPFHDYKYDARIKGYVKESLWTEEISEERDKRYDGKLYILTGEETFSAAALFASYLVRARKAVTIGRETPSGYHQMTAGKYIDLRLPNSLIDIRIPLVKCVFDEDETERTPKGRGLIPDYYVPLTFEEYYISTKDIILNKALDIIRSGYYIEHSCFMNNKVESNKYILVFIILGGSLSVLFYVYARKRRRQQ